MKSPKNLLWATGGSVAINGALLALLVLTLPKAAAPLPDDTLWVSLETAAETQTQGAPQASPLSATSQPPAASAPPVPAAADTVLPPQPPIQTPSPAASSDSKPSTSPALTATATPVASGPPAQAASTQPAAPAQTLAPSGGSKHAASYAAKVRAHIESFKVYPPQARRRHQTGMVGFSFTIDRQGRVLSARITRSSGVPALDQAALDMLEAAQPLPKPPSDMPGEPIGMTSVAEFGLTD